MSHAYACGGFPPTTRQREDSRWHELARYLFNFNVMYDDILLVPDTDWINYAGPDLHAIYTYNKDAITEQMEGQSIIYLDLNIYINPDLAYTYEDVISRFERACIFLGLEYDIQLLRLYIPLPLPQVIHSLTSLDSKDVNDICSICLDTESSMDWCQTQCGHQFHKKCIEQWREHTCPLCRSHLS